MQEKPKLKETIIVEGKYDKIKLSSILDANIVVTNGFSVFRNKETSSYIRKAAELNGIVILTDSDRAGFLIRNYIKQGIPKDKVKQAYIPDIFGKEKRKLNPSKAGTLGVEGMEPKIIMHALKNAGCTFANDQSQMKSCKIPISKSDLLLWGFTGSDNSSQRRKLVCEKLSLPSGLSANGFLDALNLLFSKEEFEQFLHNIK
jgi:ribonuclease M5